MNNSFFLLNFFLIFWLEVFNNKKIKNEKTSPPQKKINGHFFVTHRQSKAREFLIPKKNQRRNLIPRFTTIVLPSVHGMDASKYYYCITSWCKAVTNELVWFGINTVGVP